MRAIRVLYENYILSDSTPPFCQKRRSSILIRLSTYSRVPIPEVPPVRSRQPNRQSKWSSCDLASPNVEKLNPDRSNTQPESFSIKSDLQIYLRSILVIVCTNLVPFIWWSPRLDWVRLELFELFELLELGRELQDTHLSPSSWRLSRYEFLFADQEIELLFSVFNCLKRIWILSHHDFSWKITKWEIDLRENIKYLFGLFVNIISATDDWQFSRLTRQNHRRRP